MMKTSTCLPVLALACLLFSCKKDLVNEDAQLTASQTKSANQLASDCGLLRTQTPGGWGSKPSGNNPGAYLHAHFNNAFAKQLSVGCYPNYVRLTSAQAVTNLLPTGGPAAQLTMPFIDPASIKNVLVGHLVALKLSVGFDAYDANFGQSDANLGAMIIGSGTFQGWTVAQFLYEADNVIGGCSIDFTPGQVLETATAINENYVDGKINKGYLVCPGPIIED